MKRSVLILLLVISLSSLVIAQDYRLDISTSKEIHAAGENITLKVILLDSNNQPINQPINLRIEDAEKLTPIQKTVNTNEFVELNLGKDASYGYWSISTSYKELQTTTLFIVEVEELAKFSLIDNTLTITNIGNTQYIKTVQIMIGNTIGAKTPKLNIGESTTYKLVAPEGDYNIKITDGKTTLTKSSVQLTGTTGKVVGALDASSAGGASITGGIAPDEENELGLVGYIKDSKLVYVFILVVFGAMILLAIEKRAAR